MVTKNGLSLWMGIVVGFSLWIGAITVAQGRPLLHHIPAATCAECHHKIFQQWSESMHARSTALKDPIHGAFYNSLIGDPTQEGVTDKKTGKYPSCLKCHAPNAARDGKTKLDAQPAYAEGVNCVVCHTMESFKGVKAHDQVKLNLGVDAYVYAEQRLQGPYGAYSGESPAKAPGSDMTELASNSFPHAANPQVFLTSAACLGCHEQLNNPNGVPICATGPEWAARGNTVSCQSCHMPVRDGFADHSMSGGHNPAMLKRSVILEINAKKMDQGAQATVDMKNLLVHNFPTGAPFRNLVLTVSAFDVNGKSLWKNFKNNPLEEDPQAVLMLKLVDAAGRPAPPLEAKKIADDSRLKPGESRTVIYMIPVQGVALIRAELHYSLLLPAFVKKFADQLPPEVTLPTLVAQAESRF